MVFLPFVYVAHCALIALASNLQEVVAVLVALGVVRGKEAELSELQKYPLGSLLYHSRLSPHRFALHGGLGDLNLPAA